MLSDLRRARRRSYNEEHAPVAQLDRASAFEAGGRRFEPCRARQPSLEIVIIRELWLGRPPSAPVVVAGPAGQPLKSLALMKQSPDSIPLPAKILWSTIIVVLALVLWWISR